MNTKIKMQFDPQIAKDIGVEEAIMYSNIEFWVEHNKANGRNKHDGYFWTYNSMSAYGDLFPFWTHDQIRRILSKLEDGGYIKTGNYNEHKYDRTKWYTCIWGLSQMEMVEQTNAIDETPQPIPDSKPDSKLDSKHFATPSVAVEIQQVLAAFQMQINPSINYGNKTQRKAVEEMLAQLGADRLLKLIAYCAKISSEPFAPVVTTPYQLQQKQAQIAVYWKKHQNKTPEVMSI